MPPRMAPSLANTEANTVANAKKAKPSNSGRLLITYEVLQNGAALLHESTPLRRRGSLTLTSATRGPLALPYYPLPNHRLEFLRFEKGKAVLVAPHKWEGFCTSKGELVDIERGDKGRREVAMVKGDYGSITYEDLRILVRIGPPMAGAPARERTRKRAKGYRPPFVNHFLPTIEEKRSTLVGFVMATVILGCAVAGLLKRDVVRPAKFSEIAQSYILPFVDPDHLLHGPEALQTNLDRHHPVRSVIDYYAAMTSTLMGWPGTEARYVPATSLELYNKLFANVEEQEADKVARQREIDHLQDLKSDTAIAAIPAVVGESIAGSMLRIIDKTAIMHEAFIVNLKAKRDIAAVFPKDPEYSFEEYRSVSTAMNDKRAEYLAQVRPWGRTSDEEQMYAEAESLAQEANKRRAVIRAAIGETLSATSPAPIGMADGTRFASFAYGVDFMVADEKLEHLQASEYGASTPSAKTVAKEPLVGEIERSLIETFIQQHKFQLQLCYELALKRNELASGTMEWRWRIDSRGSISDISLVATNIRDNRMTQCIREKISQWRFPRPRRGSVEVSYPFEFAPSRG